RKRDIDIQSSQIVIVVGNITSGFQYKSIKFDVITNKEMIGSNKRAKTVKTKKSNKGQKIESFLDLNVGDYVVHENSGVGRYVGIDQLSVNGVKK
ncbi:hypothetical protein LJB68_14555, partial [bacterium 210820-DFI.6.52]|nr:hypothetical protein [bacterium 210820-DFI.6.52]